MANRFSNTKHVHFTHSNSKFCLNSYESDIPMFSLIIIQRHPKTHKTLLVRLSCVHAFHASEASRIRYLVRSPFSAKWTSKSIWRAWQYQVVHGKFQGGMRCCFCALDPWPQKLDELC
ncbi:hypothetical protein NC652_006840 [Populus alba x Populus x berolinensis]|nr:hypothetical protein NC652_006840 [Populus alba x Populus x berolinensis]